jgi:UDP:flavonoid glycosyltransferase YjiC (YdhE family)
VPARIVLVTAGSFGDLFPTLGLAAGLRARGHHPIVATSPHYRARVEADGLEFRPVRPDINPSDPAVLTRVMDPVRGSEYVIREFAMPYLRQSYEDIVTASRRADLIVTHPITFAAPIAAEHTGIRWISTVLAPLSFFSLHDFPVLPPMTGLVEWARKRPWVTRAFFGLARRMTHAWTAPVRALRSELGLPRVGDALYEGQFSSSGTLALFSSVLGCPQLDWPAKVSLTGFVFYGDSSSMPGDLEAFLDAGDPPLVFTLGSSAVGASPARLFYDESAKAAASLGRRAVLLVGKDPANRPSPMPKGVIAVEYAPHAALFARAAAVVHHGGVGTTAQVLRAGRPMLVVPHAHDQPDNAFRVNNLGVARVLYPKRYQAPEVASHLLALLEERSYADRSAEVGRIVRSEDGVAKACEAIESRLTTLGQD